MFPDLEQIGDLSPGELAAQYGDVLERVMFGDADFAAIFPVYPEIWCRYVLPYRQMHKGTLTGTKWQEFSEHHYSAIVRCWNARNTCSLIEESCQKIKQYSSVGESILRLHAQLLEFFGSMASALDNMEACFKQIGDTKAFGSCAGNKQSPWSLCWLFERRTQIIHKILIPIAEYSGIPSMDLSLFMDIDKRWDDENNRPVTEVGEITSRALSEFIRGMARCWATLYDLMKRKCPADKPKALPYSILHWGSFSSGIGRPDNYPDGPPHAPPTSDI